jgi:hypothetical protein
MSGPLASAACAFNRPAISDALPASAEQDFKNERLEITNGIPLEGCCMVW